MTGTRAGLTSLLLLPLLLVIAASSAAAQAASSGGADGGAPPNILLLIADDLGVDLVGASDLIGHPAGLPIATVAFAAQARAEEKRVRFVPISRGEERPAADRTANRPGGRLLASREIYALYL